MPRCPLASEARHNLYMVIREALNNTAKHSQATQLSFRLKFELDTLLISLEDNGKGFSPQIYAPLGNGLQNMRKRMESIGGRFELRSGGGQGTRIDLQIPIKPNA